MHQPLMRAFAQLHDPVFLGVVWRSVLLATLLFAAILAGTLPLVHHAAAGHGMLAWLADALGAVAALLLALFLFLPAAAAIGTLYSDRIAAAVERAFYPGLPPAQPAPLTQQVRDGIAVGLRVLGLNLLGLILTPLLPGAGFILGWAISAWAIGRGLFVAVAMRRLSRRDAEALYHTLRPLVLFQGGVMAAAAYFPLANLLIPVIGTAAMVHVLDMALTGETQTDFRRKES